MRTQLRELWIIGGLLVLATSLLFGLYGYESTKAADLLTKFAFAVLVAAVSRLFYLGFNALDGQGDAHSFEALGMLRVIDPLSDAALRRRLANAREVKVLKTWFPESRTIEEGLEGAMQKRGTKITLLLAHPDSKMLAQRAESANEPKDEGAAKVERALDRVIRWSGDRVDVDVTVGLYDSWPGCPVIWYDNKVLMGFYFRGRASPRWPWVEVKANSNLDRILKSQLDSLWTLENTLILSDTTEIAQWLDSRVRAKASKGM